MHAQNFDLTQYLQRIGYRSDPALTAVPDVATLSALMQHQLRSVPFENLDVQGGKGVSLVPEDIVAKIVHRHCGGYCYEVNGVFAMALSALGVAYDFVAARPMFYPERRPKTHMALVVHLGGERWLCDLGFGSYGLRQPFPLSQLNTPVQQGADVFQLVPLPGGELLLQAQVGGQWSNQYSFDLHPWEWVDFTPANHLNSTHPQAIFVRQLLVVQHTATGRKTLSGLTFKRVEGGHPVEQRTLTDHELPDLLQHEFNLDARRLERPAPLTQTSA